MRNGDDKSVSVKFSVRSAWKLQKRRFSLGASRSRDLRSERRFLDEKSTTFKIFGLFANQLIHYELEAGMLGMPARMVMA